MPPTTGYLGSRIPADHRPAFASWLREQMAERGMTQADLADAVGVTPAAVSLWVNGRSAPERVRLAALAKALGVSVAVALGVAGIE